MWVNKSVNPPQSSSCAAQATPPAIDARDRTAAGYAAHTALRADPRRNGPEGD